MRECGCLWNDCAGVGALDEPGCDGWGLFGGWAGWFVGGIEFVCVRVLCMVLFLVVVYFKYRIYGSVNFCT